MFPNAACVVTLVDRLLHRAEILALDGKSYRLKEPQERYPQSKIPRQKHYQGASITMIQPNDPPLVPLPTHLSEEAAVEILAFLYEFGRAFEDYYANEIGRYPHLDPLPDTDPYHELEDAFSTDGVSVLRSARLHCRAARGALTAPDHKTYFGSLGKLA